MKSKVLILALSFAIQILGSFRQGDNETKNYPPGYTELMKAIDQNNFGQVLNLLETTNQINIKSSWGQTALETALRCNALIITKPIKPINLEILELLLKSYADLDIYITVQVSMTHDDTFSVIEYLKWEKSGRSSLFPLDLDEQKKTYDQAIALVENEPQRRVLELRNIKELLFTTDIYNLPYDLILIIWNYTNPESKKRKICS